MGPRDEGRGDVELFDIERGLKGTAARRAALLLTGVAALALTFGIAHAQEATTEPAATTEPGPTQQAEPASGSTTQLDQITVVSRTEETAIETLASVSHVDQEQIARRMASTPADLLFGVPGVATQLDDRRVNSSVNIRGLQDFGRVAVIVDGARQNFQRSDHGTQSIFWIDPELIQQVDVIRGPVANTYGSGAIGGVVFFDTKDGDDFLKPGETWALSATERYETNGQGWSTSGIGAYRFTDNFNVLGNIVWRDYDDYKDGNGDDVPGSGFEVLSGLAKATIRPTENSELKLGWVGTNDSWTEGPDIYGLDIQQNTFTGRYNITDDDKSWLDLHVNLSYNKADLEQTYLMSVEQFDSQTGLPITIPSGAKTTYDLQTSGIDIWNTSRFETGTLAHELTYGGDWVQDDVETANAGGGSDVYTPSGKRRVSGAYVQEKLSWEWLEVIGALRYDSYKLEGDDTDNASGDRVSPRITVGVSPFQDTLAGLKFYGTYAEGYRSPSVTETLISGLHPAGVTFPFLPNPDLKPETAKTWEFGVNYAENNIFTADDALRLKAAYFDNDVEDYIGGAEIDAGVDNCPYLAELTPIWEGGAYIPTCFQYQNFANAKIRGFELEGVYEAYWGFLGLSASVIDGHTISYDGVEDDLLTVPSAQVTGQVGFRFLEDRLLVGGEVQYNGAPEGNETADDFTLVNVFANYKFNDNLKLDLRVDNIFNVEYVNPLNVSTTEPIYEPGVSFKVALTQRFGS